MATDAAGTTAAHNLIGGNVPAALHGPARSLVFQVSAFTLQLLIFCSASFHSPDVMVCPAGAEADQVRDPLALVEVLSEHTALRDRAKYAAYTALPCLVTYLLVEQTERRVRVYTCEEQVWVLTELSGSGDSDPPCLEGRLTADQIYGGVPDCFRRNGPNWTAGLH